MLEYQGTSVENVLKVVYIKSFLNKRRLEIFGPFPFHAARRLYKPKYGNILN
jgi:hypothetical protein